MSSDYIPLYHWLNRKVRVTYVTLEICVIFTFFLKVPCEM